MGIHSLGNFCGPSTSLTLYQVSAWFDIKDSFRSKQESFVTVCCVPMSLKPQRRIDTIYGFAADQAKIPSLRPCSYRIFGTAPTVPVLPVTSTAGLSYSISNHRANTSLLASIDLASDSCRRRHCWQVDPLCKDLTAVTLHSLLSMAGYGS